MIAFMPHEGPVTALAFSPDGTRLVSVGGDGALKVWDATRLGPTGLVWEVEDAHVSGISHAQYAPDGSVIYTGGSDGFTFGVVKAWGAERGDLRAQTDPNVHPDASSVTVNALVASLCGKFVVYGGGYMNYPSEFVVARASDLTPLHRVPGHDGAVGVFVAQEDGFVTGSADRTVRLWDWTSTKSHGTIDLRGVVRALASSRDGRHYAIAGGAIIHRYRTGTWPELRVERGQLTDDRRRYPARDGEFRGHTKRVECAEFSPDGTKLASASADGTVRVWDVKTESELRAFHPKLGPLHWVTFAPDGLTLAFSSRKGHVGLLDLDD
jgi:WD40 repeat protein